MVVGGLRRLDGVVGKGRLVLIILGGSTNLSMSTMHGIFRLAQIFDETDYNTHKAYVGNVLKLLLWCTSGSDGHYVFELTGIETIIP